MQADRVIDFERADRGDNNRSEMRLAGAKCLDKAVIRVGVAVESHHQMLKAAALMAFSSQGIKFSP